MSAHITDKVIPVTGATSGMGRAAAERVTADGAKVRAGMACGSRLGACGRR